MRLRLFYKAARLAVVLMALLLCGLSSRPSGAQLRYRNIINQRFRTISNGPQSALIVDVDESKDPATIRRAVEQSYKTMRQAQDPILLKELALMRRTREIKPGRQFDMVDVAVVRHTGKLALPPVNRGVDITRSGGAPNTLTFNFPTSGTDGWTTAKAQQLVGLSNALIGELTKVLGAPGWKGTVNVLNKDPYLGTVNEILGALFVLDSTTSPATYEIWFPSFTDAQTEFLAMAQAMAQAWHGPAMIGYDAWEKGMARAVAIIAAQDLQFYPGTNTTIDPANGFYYTPDYDLLNQPALGNNTFTPPTKGAEVGPTVNPTQYGGMIIPRLSMSGTAWLKCYIENPSFFQTFNTAYYAAFAGDNTVANDVNRLRGYAAGADTNVEGQAFDNWYEQQFVLDTSITVGVKLYAHVFATFPDSTTGASAGAGIYLIYYQTSSTGDETDLNNTCQAVYWDYNFANRLSLPGVSSGGITIADGFGTTAPYFTGIGGTPANVMRVAMDFPVGKEYVRVYFPAGQTGTDATPNDFSGVVVGQDSGTLTAVFNSGGTITTVSPSVTQGDFGTTGLTGIGFSRTKLTLALPGTPNVTFYRNVFIRPGDVSPTFQLVAPGPTTTLQHTFSNGLSMISLPIRPLTSDLASVIGTDPTHALMAQYREDNTIGSDQYLRYPTLPLYQPGYGLWTDLAATITNANVVGLETDAITQPYVEVALEFGWNQIGPPYTSPLDISSTGSDDLQFQYLGGDVTDYAGAIAAGWIATGITAYSQSNGYEVIDGSTDTAVPANTLEPWNGYWIRVIVPEGVTLTYLSPSSRAARSAARRASGKTRAAANSRMNTVGSWKLPLQLSDTQGHSAIATLGQAGNGSDSFSPALDIASPPTISNITPLALRFPAKQGDPVTKGSPGDLITDIRRSSTKTQWDLAVTLPPGQKQYTLSWQDVAQLPRGMQLTLLDKSTGTSQTINTTSSYTFQVGKNETTRQFQVTATPRAIGRLAIMNVNAVTPKTPRGVAPAAMTISFEISGPAQTTAVIQLNGRTVRHLAQNGRAVEAGVNQMVWDYKDDKGKPLVDGAYSLQITAQTSEGERTRTIVPINVVR